MRTLAQAAGVSASCWIREAMWQRFDREAVRGAGPAATATGSSRLQASKSTSGVPNRSKRIRRRVAARVADGPIEP